MFFLVHTVTFSAKELSFCHKLWFSNSYNLATHSLTPFIFRTINSVRSNSLSLKYHRFTPSGCKDIGIRKFEFVANSFLQKIHFLRFKFFLNVNILKHCRISSCGFIIHWFADFCNRGNEGILTDFITFWFIKRSLFNIEKRLYLQHCYSDKGLKGTVVNQAVK